MRRRAKKKEPTRKELKLHIDSLGSGADGVALDSGNKVYVPYVLPGEDIVADVTGKRGFASNIQTPSIHRQRAPCAHFTVCGGCSLQHVKEEFYLRWKREQVVTALGRERLDVEVAPVIKTSPSSRRRAVFVAEKVGKEVHLGFQRAKSHQVVDLQECVILDPALFAVRPTLKKMIELLRIKSARVSVTRCIEGFDVSIEAKACTFPDALIAQDIADLMRAPKIVRTVLNDEPLMMTMQPTVNVASTRLPLPPGGFLQASEEGQNILIDLVAKATQGRKKVADLFCGSGTFALALAETASVVAVDSHGLAIEALKTAIAMAQQRGTTITPVKAAQRNLFETPLQADELSKFDAVIFDPPRAGASAQVACLAKSKVPLIVGVSCNPKSFARDAKELVEGGYTLTQVTPVDQFVYTSHIELVGVFERR